MNSPACASGRKCRLDELAKAKRTLTDALAAANAGKRFDARKKSGKDMYVSMVDRILSIQPFSEVRAVKNLSFRENYLRDHFPGFPMMPGALQLEALMQAGQWLLRHSLDFPRADFVPVNVSNSRYSKYVRPGDQLVLKVTLLERTDTVFKFRGSGEVDGTRTVAGQFELMRYEHSWTNVEPETAAAILREQKDTLRRLTQIPAFHAPMPEVGQTQEI